MPGHVSLIEEMDRVAGPGEVGDDAEMQVREGQDQVRRDCQDLGDVGTGGGRHPGLLATHLGWTHGIAGNADDPVLPPAGTGSQPFPPYGRQSATISAVATAEFYR